jgi:ABC-type transporter Mla MlaB component
MIMSTLALPPRLTLAEAVAAASDLVSKASGLGANGSSSARLEFDASGVQAFDSSAFAVILDVVRRSTARSSGEDPSTRLRTGRMALVRQAPPSMVALAKLYGADDLIDFEARA